MPAPALAAKVVVSLSDKKVLSRIIIAVLALFVAAYSFIVIVPISIVSTVFLKFLPDIDNPENDCFVAAIAAIISEKSIDNDFPIPALKAIDFIEDGEMMEDVGKVKAFALKHFVESHKEKYTVEIPGKNPGDPPRTETRERTVYSFVTTEALRELLAASPFGFAGEDVDFIMALYAEAGGLPDSPLPPLPGDGVPTGGGISSIVGGNARLTRGWHDTGISSGIDIGAAKGSPCYAMFDGTVKYYLWTDHDGALVGYGACAFLYSDDGSNKAVYAHLSQFNTPKSALTIGSMPTKQVYRPTFQKYQYSINVKKGDVIGRVGNTGYSFGNHLHFGLHIGGVAVDPLKYLK